MALCEPIAERILSDFDLKARKRIPGVRDLASRYGVSVVTARRAVGILRDRGLVEAHPGRGIRSCVYRRPVVSGGEMPSPADNLDRRLEVLVRSSPGRRLRPLRELAAEFDVGIHSIARAIGRLRKRGLVSVAPGRGIVVTSQPSSTAGTRNLLRPRRDDTLVERVRTGILNGDYPVDRAMPKMAVLARQYGVSNGAVTKAYRALLAEGLLHRRGRRYYSGAMGDHSVVRTPVAPPVVLVLLWKNLGWQRLTNSPRLSSFFQAFMAEMNDSELEAQVIQATVAPRGSGPETGLAAVAEAAGRWGDRFGGVLMLGNSDDYRFRGVPFCEAVVWLCRLGRPVVWFDSSDEPESHWGFRLTKREFPTTVLPNRHVKRLFYRCHYDEYQGVRLALMRLRDLGHRTIGIPWHGPTEGLAYWVRHRVALIRRAREELGGPLRLVVDPRPAAAASHTPVSVARPGGERSQRVLRELLDRMKGMGVTAVIGLNDELSRLIYESAVGSGIRIPEDMSLVSFDARMDVLFPRPISSVDFGFGHLGRTAVHCFAEDRQLPVRKDRGIAGVCRINHAGTLARPRG